MYKKNLKIFKDVENKTKTVHNINKNCEMVVCVNAQTYNTPPLQ